MFLLKRDAPPSRAAVRKPRDKRPENSVVYEAGQHRRAVGKVVGYGVFDPYCAVKPDGAQRIVGLANNVGRQYLHGAQVMIARANGYDFPSAQPTAGRLSFLR
jgi:hypothetical protein